MYKRQGVWLGGNVVVNPGVTVGDGAVVGSGSVVTRDIPPNVVAAGNPCRVLREITEDDRAHWRALRDEYRCLLYTSTAASRTPRRTIPTTRAAS